MRLGYDSFSRVARFVFVLTLLNAWLVQPGYLRAQGAAPSPGERAERVAGGRPADQLDRVFDAIAATVKQIPRDSFDVETIVDQVGRDPAKLFAWVRDNTFWAPYRGTLRGATGVLIGSAGKQPRSFIAAGRHSARRRPKSAAGSWVADP